MNTLPLILGGGILVYLISQDKKKSNNTNSQSSNSSDNKLPTLPDPESEITSQIGSKDVGYEIINCNKVIIYDEKKAFSYAFTFGAAEATKNAGKFEWDDQIFEESLVGDCLEKLEDKKTYKTKEDAMKAAKKFFYNKTVVKFIYNLFRYLYGGYVTISMDDLIKLDFINELIKMKDAFKEMGFDTTDLQTNLPTVV